MSSAPGEPGEWAEDEVPKRLLEGTHRAAAIEETLERARLAMPAVNITRVATITGLDVTGIPSVAVYRPGAHGAPVAAGKGLSLAAAKVSGLMEAIASYHAEHITSPLRLASVDELSRTCRVVHAGGLPMPAASPFHAGMRLLWIEGCDLLRGAPVWVPFEVVHLCLTLPLPTGSGAFRMGSAGLAAGNHMLEAISHGICEVVERDAIARWTTLDDEARRQTRIDLETVSDAACRAVLCRYDRAGIDVAVWETTSEACIPSFLCVLADRSLRTGREAPAVGGAGCHPAREIALLRALIDAAQRRLARFGTGRGIAGCALSEDQPLYVEAASRASAEMHAEAPMRSLSDVPTWCAETIRGDLLWQLERLRAAGVTEVVAVDLKKPEIGIPVARVVIPGLAAIHTAPGERLRGRVRPGARGV